MASSNRHWPSMFKSKPNHQWQHDVSPSLISSNGCHRNPYTPGIGGEERTPEPKPRWNPRPEQIRILEAIFNSGMVNPPRDEIRKIRAQLQEFGQVGDANVFYWFQNRKSRSKHKQRQQLQSSAAKSHPPPPTTATPLPITTITTTFVNNTARNSSQSSSDKSSPNNSDEKSLSVGPTTVIDLLNSPTASTNQQQQQQPFIQASSEFLADPFFFPVQQNSPSVNSGEGFYFPDQLSSGLPDQGVGNCHNFLLSELMLMGNCRKDDDEKMKREQHLSYAATSVSNPAHPFLPASFCAGSPINHFLQGVGESAGPIKSTVFINDVCFEVGVGPFNVREAFGNDAVLIQSSGQPVMSDEWGFTAQPLQHGAFYYLLRPFMTSPDDRNIN